MMGLPDDFYTMANIPGTILGSLILLVMVGAFIANILNPYLTEIAMLLMLAYVVSTIFFIMLLDVMDMLRMVLRLTFKFFFSTTTNYKSKNFNELNGSNLDNRL